jgi:hypothetical protein
MQQTTGNYYCTAVTIGGIVNSGGQAGKFVAWPNT